MLSARHHSMSTLRVVGVGGLGSNVFLSTFTSSFLYRGFSRLPAAAPLARRPPTKALDPCGVAVQLRAKPPARAAITYHMLLPVVDRGP